MADELPTLEELQDEPVEVVEPVERQGSALPLILTIVAVLIWFAFQTVQLVLERNNLSTMKTNFESAMQESQKMQTQLQALITKTAELANQGNPAAKAAVEELEKRGIPIKGVAPQPSK
jgi:predicted component of type VI protein secretion system